MDTLEEALLKSNLYIERYSPKSQILISKNLDKAYKEIATLVSTTTNKAKIKAEVNRIMNEVFYALPDEVVKDMIEISDVSYTATSAIMQSYVSAELASQALKFKDVREAAIQRLESPTNLIQGHSLQEHFKHLNATSTHKIQGQILKGFSDGLGIDEINRSIYSSMTNIDRNQTKTLIRTSVLEASRKSMYEALDSFDDEIIEYYYNGVLDTRTTARCWTLTTQNTRSKNKQDIIALLDFHYNCRSLLGVRTEYSEDIEAKTRNIVEWDASKIEPRQTRDGMYRIGKSKSIFNTPEEAKIWYRSEYGAIQTKFKLDEIRTIELANMTPEKAFKKLSVDYQEEYMGKGRYKLWTSGKASFESMIDISRNDFLPLHEIKKRLKLK